MTFDGASFDEGRDGDRLRAQFAAVFLLMSDGYWWTLAELSERTGYPEASISARIRDFRKVKFGGHTVLREHAGNGQWEYRLIVAADAKVGAS